LYHLVFALFAFRKEPEQHSKRLPPVPFPSPGQNNEDVGLGQ